MKAKTASPALRKGGEREGTWFKRYQAHPNQIDAWTKQLLDQAARPFQAATRRGVVEHEREFERLNAKIGQLESRR